MQATLLRIRNKLPAPLRRGQEQKLSSKSFQAEYFPSLVTCPIQRFSKIETLSDIFLIHISCSNLTERSSLRWFVLQFIYCRLRPQSCRLVEKPAKPIRRDYEFIDAEPALQLLLTRAAKLPACRNPPSQSELRTGIESVGSDRNYDRLLIMLSQPNPTL